MDQRIVRTVAIRDVALRRADDGSDDRILDAYAAVFDSPAEVFDWEGHYDEVIKRGAFRKTLNDLKGDRLTRLKVLFNHGKDIHGIPRAEFSLPIGTPISVKEDTHGLITSTRMARTDFTADIISLIEDQAIDAMSFTSIPVQSKTKAGAGRGGIDLIERLELRLVEYGPAVFPVYDDAVITGMRAQFLAEQVAGLDEGQRAELVRILTGGAPPAPTDQPALSPALLLAHQNRMRKSRATQPAAKVR